MAMITDGYVFSKKGYRVRNVMLSKKYIRSVIVIERIGFVVRKSVLDMVSKEGKRGMFDDFSPVPL